jgi:hypothetical protein
MNIRNQLYKGSPIQAVGLAVVLLVVGELLLVWQYNNFKERHIAEVEEKLQEQEQLFEEREARDALEGFFEARLDQDEKRFVRYVTEETMLQRDRGVFEPYGVENYKINSKEQVANGLFLFQIAVTQDRLEHIEFVEVRKILEQYYVNSVELAG